MPARNYICPACHQKTGVDILYGMPDTEAQQMADRGEIVLGGCCIDLEGPERQCTACGHQWRVKRRLSTEENHLLEQYGLPDLLN
jgi:hypothetical protein